MVCVIVKMKSRFNGIVGFAWNVICLILIITGISTLFSLLNIGKSINSREKRILNYHPQFPIKSINNLPGPHLKTILLWNTWFDWDPAFFFGTGQEPFIEAGCPITDCYISNERYLMPIDEYDAVLFFFPMMTDFPFTYSRKASQIYAFVNEEPPTLEMRTNLTHFNDFFNMTITYRSDSDIQWPYGLIHRRARSSENQVQINYASGKKKQVAWFVSNCESDSFREKYVENLKKYIQVDVYGKCGDQQCWAGDQESCYQMLENDYKFYLSFENSFCKDYVTEKFFQMMDRRIIPIVYGAANYTQLAPKNSYIDATQMGAKKLAQILRTIDSDDTLYNDFFWWKPYYKVVKEKRSMARSTFCNLCQQLHQAEGKQQIYRNFQGWWGLEENCHTTGVFSVPFKTFSFQSVPSNHSQPEINDTFEHKTAKDL